MHWEFLKSRISNVGALKEAKPTRALNEPTIPNYASVVEVVKLKEGLVGFYMFSPKLDFPIQYAF